MLQCQWMRYQFICLSNKSKKINKLISPFHPNTICNLTIVPRHRSASMFSMCLVVALFVSISLFATNIDVYRSIKFYGITNAHISNQHQIGFTAWTLKMNWLALYAYISYTINVMLANFVIEKAEENKEK